jgi:hypothetical protein
VTDGDAIRERVRDGVRLLDELIEAETLVLREGKGRTPETVELLEPLAERLPEVVREA